MEYCEMYSKLRRENISGANTSFCFIEKCPYRNGIHLEWGGEYALCSTDGMVEKSGLIEKIEEKKTA